jgi:hypothetical protein
LFPGALWIRQGGTEVALPTAEDGGMPGLMPSLDVLVASCRRGGGAGASVELLVSDSIARNVVLPWQEAPLTPVQEHAYAQACLERAGVDLEAGWTLHSGFRHYGQVGLAVAVPTAWLDDARGRFAAVGLRLRRVTPVTAAAYWATPGGIGRAPGLLLLAEPGRITAVQRQGGRFSGLDVEPAGADPALALRRLLNRTRAAGLPVTETPVTVQLWQARAGLIDRAHLARELPAARIRGMGPGVWSK